MTPESPLLDDLQFVSLAKEFAFVKKRAGETHLLFQFKDMLSTRFPARSIPRKVLIVGGGVKACEQAQALSHLGAEVMMICDTTVLLPDFDPMVSSHIERVFRSQEIRIFKESFLKGQDGPFYIVEQGKHSPVSHKLQADQILEVEHSEWKDPDQMTLAQLSPLVGVFGPPFSEAVRRHGHQGLLRIEVAKEGLGRILLILEKKSQTLVAVHALGKGVDVLVPYLFLARQTETPWPHLHQLISQQSVLFDWLQAINDEVVLMQSAS